jgi:hypothetical protein
MAAKQPRRLAWGASPRKRHVRKQCALKGRGKWRVAVAESPHCEPASQGDSPALEHWKPGLLTNTCGGTFRVPSLINRV